MHILVEQTRLTMCYAYDIVRDRGIPVMLDPGKHSNDHAEFLPADTFFRLLDRIYFAAAKSEPIKSRHTTNQCSGVIGLDGRTQNGPSAMPCPD
ncbi:MAG: hypothetical protein IPN48_05685 [Sphingomonadales bacterium]|nr:hypothetical protein [Sphingomonadales bacterium]